MRSSSFNLTDRIYATSQIEGSAPSVSLYLRQRYFDYPDDAHSSHDLELEWYQMTNRLISVEVSENIDQFASAFTVTLANELGELAPENYPGKWPNPSYDNQFESIATHYRQLLHNNQMKLYLGYGDELLPFIHGWVDDVRMSSDGKSIVVTCMTSYKHLIHTTVKEDSIEAPEGNLFDVLKYFFTKCNVTLKGQKVFVPGTDEEWVIRKAKGKRGQSYDEIVRELIDTTFHYIQSNFDGTCTLVQKPRFDKTDAADVIFDEDHNLTTLEYNITDQDVYNAVTIKSGSQSSRYNSRFLEKTVLLYRWKEEMLDVPWANSYFKRREVAIAHQIENFQKWQTLSAGVIADPRLELWDKVGIREKTSSITSNWHIKGLQTTFDPESGFFQVLDLAVNIKPDPGMDSDLSPITVNVPTIRLKVWDWSIEDGDYINIYCEGKVIELNYKLRNQATYVDIDLNVGNNMIIFEGVNAGRKLLTGRLQVLDTADQILFDVGSLPDLTFNRTNADKKGKYRIKPQKTWLVARLP